MDRDKVSKPTAQIGFIKFVLIPLFELLNKVLIAIPTAFLALPWNLFCYKQASPWTYGSRSFLSGRVGRVFILKRMHKSGMAEKGLGRVEWLWVSRENQCLAYVLCQYTKFAVKLTLMRGVFLDANEINIFFNNNPPSWVSIVSYLQSKPENVNIACSFSSEGSCFLLTLCLK